MRINKKLASSIGSALGLMVLSTAPAMAASSFNDHLWQFVSGDGTTTANVIDFNKGMSRIFDDVHLTLSTDDDLILNVPGTVFVNNVLTANSLIARGDATVGNNLSVGGTITGNLTGNVTGNTAGVHTGAVTGAVTGNVTGNLTGNVTGDVTGNVTGNTTGTHTGNVTTNAINATTSGTVMHIGESTDVVILGATGNVTNVAGTLTTDGNVTVGGTITLQNGETIGNATNGIVAVGGNALVNGARVLNAPTGSGDVPENFLKVTGAITGVGDAALGSANTRGVTVDMTRAASNNTVRGDTQDNGLKININNRSTANATGYSLRGMDVSARSRTSGNTTSIYGAYITGENSDDGGAAGDVYGVQANAKNGGVASGIVAALYAQNQSPSATGTNYGVLVDNSSEGTVLAKNAGVAVKSTDGSWNYGLDMNGATINTADIRLAAGTTIGSGATNPAACVKGSIYLNTTSGHLNVCEDANTWTAK